MQKIVLVLLALSLVLSGCSFKGWDIGVPSDENKIVPVIQPETHKVYSDRDGWRCSFEQVVNNCHYDFNGLAPSWCKRVIEQDGKATCVEPCAIDCVTWERADTNSDSNS